MFWISSVLLVACTGAEPEPEPEPIIDASRWADPPMSARPMVRWWWREPTSPRDAIAQDLDAIASAGFGGVELQSFVFGLKGDTSAVRQVGTEDYASLVGASIRGARASRPVLRPHGGVGVAGRRGTGWRQKTWPVSSWRLLLRSPVPRPSMSCCPWCADWYDRVNDIVPALGAWDPDGALVTVVAGRLAPGAEREFTELISLDADVIGDRLAWDVPEGDWVIWAIRDHATSHVVVGGAFPGDREQGWVVDHLSAAGAVATQRDFTQPLLDALGPDQPDTWFVDSFELLGELPWSDVFAERFEEMHGYDLLPHLPLVFWESGEGEVHGALGASEELRYVGLDGDRIREDYEATRADLFLTFARGMGDLGLPVRIQAHGGWGDLLDVYAVADVPSPSSSTRTAPSTS